MGFCRRHCTSQVADRSHGRVGCRSWPTVRGRATSCIGRRYPTTKASKATIHFGLLAHRESLPTHLEMRAGKPRAPATSIDAMLRLASARTTTMWMQPEEHVAVTASVMLSSGYFVPKCSPPAARPTAKARRGGTEAPAHRTGQSRLRAAAPPSSVAEGRPEPARAPAPALTPPAPRPARC